MIIQCSKNETDTLAKIVTELWDDLTYEEALKEISENLSIPTIAYFLAFKDGEAIGFTEVSLRSDYVEGTVTSPVGYLEGIYVKSSYQHKGIGKKLVQVCEEWAREKGCTEFASDCELTNKESLAFHNKVGFQEANRIICFTKKL